MSGSMMITLRERLANWTDLDVANYHVAIVIGLIPELDNMQSFRIFKWMTNSHNPYGTLLQSIINDMVKAGCLVYDDEGLQITWNDRYILP